MKIILKERVENLGRSGDIVNVKDGYARNFLIPKGFAVTADRQSIKFIEHNKRIIQKKVDKEKKDLSRVSELIAKKTYIIERKLSSEDKLYGSVTANDIFEKLIEDGFNIFKKDVIFDTVKKTGEYKAKVDLGFGIEPELSVIVKGDGTGTVQDEEKELKTEGSDEKSLEQELEDEETELVEEELKDQEGTENKGDEA